MRTNGGLIHLDQVCNFAQTVSIHYVHRKDGSLGDGQQLHHRQDFVGSQLVGYVAVVAMIVFEVESFAGLERVGIEFMVLPVIANGRINQDCSEPGFERMRRVIIAEVLKHFQKSFIHHVFGFFWTGCIAQADALGIAKKQLEQRPLCWGMTSSARSQDAV